MILVCIIQYPKRDERRAWRDDDDDDGYDLPPAIPSNLTYLSKWNTSSRKPRLLDRSNKRCQPMAKQNLCSPFAYGLSRNTWDTDPVWIRSNLAQFRRFGTCRLLGQVETWTLSAKAILRLGGTRLSRCIRKGKDNIAMFRSGKRTFLSHAGKVKLSADFGFVGWASLQGRYLGLGDYNYWIDHQWRNPMPAYIQFCADHFK